MKKEQKVWYTDKQGHTLETGIIKDIIVNSRHYEASSIVIRNEDCTHVVAKDLVFTTYRKAVIGTKKILQQKIKMLQSMIREFKTIIKKNEADYAKNKRT